MPLRRPLSRPPLLACSLALACAGQAADGSTEAGSETGESGTDGTDGTGESGSTGGEDCGAFTPEDDELGETIEVVIRNDRAETIWVANARATDCFIEQPFEVRDADDELLVWRTLEDEFQCAQVLDPIAGCGWECGVVQPVFRIEPGAELLVEWRGVRNEVELPAACGGCQATCWLPGPVPAGSYTLRATAGTECGGECCEPDDTGVCTGVVEPGSGPAGEVLEASAPIEIPGAGTVELAFE
jgi:hypothetical protein